MRTKTICILLAAVAASPLLLLSAQQAVAAGTNIEGIAGFQDTPLEPDGKWHVHDPARPQPPVVTPAKSFSLGAAAPSDAEVLFDGKGLEKWQAMSGAPANW